MRENSITVNRNTYPYHDSISLRANEQQIGRYQGLDDLTTRDGRNQTLTAFGRNLRAQVKRYWYNGPYDQPQNAQFRTFERTYGNKNGRLWIPREANRNTLLNALPGDAVLRTPLPSVDPHSDPTLFIARSIDAMTRAFGVEGGADDCPLIGALVDATRDRHPDGDVLHAPESFDAVIRRTGVDYRDVVELPILASRGGRDTAIYYHGVEEVAKNLAQNFDFVARVLVESLVTEVLGNTAGSGRTDEQHAAALRMLNGELNGSLYARHTYVNTGYVNSALGVLANFDFPRPLDEKRVVDAGLVFGAQLSQADIDDVDPDVIYDRLYYIWKRLDDAENDMIRVTNRFTAAEKLYLSSPNEQNAFYMYTVANDLARLQTAPLVRSEIARTLNAFRKAEKADTDAPVEVKKRLTKEVAELATLKSSVKPLTLTRDNAQSDYQAAVDNAADLTKPLADLTKAKTALDNAEKRIKELDTLIADETQKAVQAAKKEVGAKAKAMRDYAQTELFDAAGQRRLIEEASKKNIEFYPQVAGDATRYEALLGVATALLVVDELRALTFPAIVSQAALYPNMTREFQTRRRDEASVCAEEIEAAIAALATRDLGRLRAFASAPTMIFLNTPGGAKVAVTKSDALRNKFREKFAALRAEWRI
jgi:hypothetical protein